MLRDLADFLTFYDVPQEHRIHLHTTKPIESILAGVLLRTGASKRAPSRENAQYLVFEVIDRLSQTWRRMSGSNLCELLLCGRRFVDGQLGEADVSY